MKLIKCNAGHLYSSDSHNTCPYCSSSSKISINREVKKDNTVVAGDDNKTMIHFLKDNSVSAVVGWLVCISGIEKGRDFRIVSERNFIGRSEDMDIVLANDTNVARKNHCSITYNPKQRIFMLSPGESNGIVYLQNKGVYESKQIYNMDILEIGQSRFIFVALCGEKFDWNI